MRIGLDFDNTVVSYDSVFHETALEQALIPPDVPMNKNAVRDYLRAAGREDEWTTLQGLVYGTRMARATAFTGVIEFVREMLAARHDVFIVSHKTRHPYRGPEFDLHAAARDWIAVHLSPANGVGLLPEHVFFEITKAAKIERIATCRCDVFVDDLPEILLDPAFPPVVERILFDPEGGSDTVAPGVRACSAWPDVAFAVRTLGVRT